MYRECIVTIGVSGSGKTTWAEKMCRDSGYVNINRDDIRKEILFSEKGLEFSWTEWGKNMYLEKIVMSEWKKRLNEALNDPNTKGIVVSDTNLNLKTRDYIQAAVNGTDFIVCQKLFPIEYKDAIKRDLCRRHPVGQQVIAKQLVSYWNQFERKYIPDQSLRKAVIVDIDGTLAHSTKRKIFDYTRVHEDQLDEFVGDIVWGLNAQGYLIILVSGRDDICFDSTSSWFESKLGISVFRLFMRKTGDKRSDAIVKREIFWDKIASKYNVIGVIDDRPKVVRVYHSIGLRVIACGNQHIEF